MNKQDMESIYNIKLAQFIDMLHTMFNVQVNYYDDYIMSIDFKDTELLIKLETIANYSDVKAISKMLPYYEITGVKFDLDIYTDIILDELVTKLTNKENKNEEN